MRKKNIHAQTYVSETPAPAPAPALSVSPTQTQSVVTFAPDDEGPPTSYTHSTSPDPHSSPSCPTTEFLCFICNSSYFTTVSRDSVDLNRAQVSILCEAFSVPGPETETLEALISSLKEPFCESCLAMVKQLEEDILTVNLLNKRIHEFKICIAKTLSTSFPQSPIDVGGAYWVKVKMVQNSEPLLHSHSTNELQLYEDAETEPIHVVEISGVGDGEGEGIGQDEGEQENQTNQDQNESQDQEEPAATPITQPISTPTEVDRSTLTLSSLLDRPVKVIPRPPKRKLQQQQTGAGKHKGRDFSAGMPQAYAEMGTRSLADLDDTGICKICTHQFNSKIALWKHLKRQHSGTTYKCRHCNQIFKDVSNRNRHEKSIHLASARDCICLTCGRGFKTNEMLYAHNKYTHQGFKQKQRIPEPSLCPHCGKLLSCQKNLVLHIRANHGRLGDGKIQLKYCPICQKPFKITRNLKPHIRSHCSPLELIAMGETLIDYKCTKCPDEIVGFNSKSALIKHYETDHPSELRPNIKMIERKPARKKKLHVCEDCPTKPGYTTVQGLQNHIGSGHMINGTKVLFCKYCDKICLGYTRLKEHEKSHPDIKPEKRQRLRKAKGVLKKYKINQLLEFYGIKDCCVQLDRLEGKEIKKESKETKMVIQAEGDAEVEFVLSNLVKEEIV